MYRLLLAATLLVLVGLSCQRPQGTAEPTGSPAVEILDQFIRLLADMDIESRVVEIEGKGIEPCLGTPQRSYDIGAGGRFHLFLYKDEQEAARVASEIPANGDCPSTFDWAYDVWYFRYGQLIIFLASEDSAAKTAIENVSGPAFACAPGPGQEGDSSCLK